MLCSLDVTVTLVSVRSKEKQAVPAPVGSLETRCFFTEIRMHRVTMVKSALC